MRHTANICSAIDIGRPCHRVRLVIYYENDKVSNDHTGAVIHILLLV